MPSAIRFGRRAAAAVLGAGAIAAGVVATAATAGADPGCTVADMTGVETGVAAGMTTYLWTHPEVNDFLTSVQGLSPDDAFTKTRDYLIANPDIKAQMDAIQAPADDLRARCNIPVTNIIRGVL